MSTYETVKEVIGYSKVIHAHIRGYYEALSKKSQSERVKLMLEYLIEEQRQAEGIVGRLEEATDPSILESWMQYAPSFDIAELIRGKPIQADLSLDEIVNITQEFSERLIDFYREAANESELPKVQELFENLVELEKKENAKQLQASAFEDM